jgi:hypothetical protein
VSRWRASSRSRATHALYDEDFHAWTEHTARLLRAGRAGDADLDHVAEEIEDLGKRDANELDSRMQILLLHLLKWHFQPRGRCRSWASTIAAQRDGIEGLLVQSPSLRRHLEQRLADNYRRGRRRAAIETGLCIDAFPPACPYAVARLLDESFLPG